MNTVGHVYKDALEGHMMMCLIDGKGERVDVRLLPGAEYAVLACMARTMRYISEQLLAVQIAMKLKPNMQFIIKEFTPPQKKMKRLVKKQQSNYTKFMSQGLKDSYRDHPELARGEHMKSVIKQYQELCAKKLLLQ